MASERQQWMFPPDVKRKIQKKIDLLRETTVGISSMETELTKLKLQKAELEKELACYRLEASAAKLGPIARCPEEVLLIFKQFLVFDHSQIRRLLFVCKRWHNLVINSPHLWARIEITDALKLLYYKNCTLPSKIPYVLACYERSKSLPLDVELNLESFPSVEGYIKEELYRIARDITDNSEYENIEDEICNVDLVYSSQWIDHELSRALEHLFGTNEIRVNRWKSLVLALPVHEDPGLEVWRRIRRSSSSVAKLEVTMPVYDWGEFGIDPSDTPHLPQIQRLTFRGIPERMVAQVGEFPDALRFLEIVVVESAFLKQLSSLSALTNLRTLTLHIRHFTAQPSQINPSKINPLQLEALTLYASSHYVGQNRKNIGYIQPVTWKLLQRACMIHQASPRHVYWHFCASRTSGTEIVNTIREVTVSTVEGEARILREWVRQQVLDATKKISGGISVNVLMVRSERVALSV